LPEHLQHLSQIDTKNCSLASININWIGSW